MRNQKSDKKFVEWSKTISAQNYDSKTVIEFLNNKKKSSLNGLDIGGGCGTFAKTIVENTSLDINIDILDPSKLALDNFDKSEKTNLIPQYFNSFESNKKYDFIILKTVLHHIIGIDENTTLKLQEEFITKAVSMLNDDGVLFVEENFYEGWLKTDITGKLIFFWTKLKIIESVIRFLGANTAGEGVRFRSRDNWRKIFNSHDLMVVNETLNPTWGNNFSFLYKILLMCTGCYQSMIILQKNKSL